MARERNPERDKARRIWLDSGGTLTARQVAEQVGVKPEQVRKWKSLDSWAAELEAQKPPRKRGGQPGNKNAAGAGAPHGNRNAETHGAYSTVRLADLPDEQREYIESITLDTGTNMLSELQLLIAKEADLQSKIAKIENGDPDALYIDRVVEMRAPKSTERLEQQQEKLETLRRKRDDLTWEIDSGPDGKPPSKAKQKQLDALQREIAALEDTTADRQMELEKSSYKVNMQTVIKASAFDRAMKLEAELNKIHGRIIKLLDSIKGYEMESRRLRLEERKYNLAKQKLYIGGGKVIECSPAFKNCVQVTACLNIGAISGMNGRKWTKHGKLPYITYDTAGGAQDGAGSTTKPSGTTTTPATLAFAVGDVVRFTGNTHYTNAAAASGAACKPGTAKVTALAKGAKHPYHLIKQPGGGSTVYGWVNAADVQAVGSGTTAPKMRVGAKVKYSGPLYRDSNGGGQGKTVNGTYTVKYYYPARKCGVHIDGLGWVPESGCTVIG